jgi:hypothetical protein
MGYDISNHAIDVAFIRERLIPFVMGHGTLDDLDDAIDRATRLSLIAHRANTWGLRTMQLDHAIHDAQREAGVPRSLPPAPPPQPPRLTLWQRLTSARPAASPPSAPAMAWVRTSGIPGFDSDLSVWGRPFFIVAGDTDETLREFDAYMQAGEDDVDAIAQRMLGRLDAMHDKVDPRCDPEVVAVLEAFRPLEAHLPQLDASDAAIPDRASVRSHIERKLLLMRRFWGERTSDKPIEDDLLDEPVAPSDYIESLPFDIINLASQTLPGWMGRGHVWPTRLFEKIGVKVHHLFETPESLFQDLVREDKRLRGTFSTTIPCNYSLGGYVPPEKVEAFIALLDKHRNDLILAWSDRKDPAEIDDMLAADYTKILEPALLARRNGYGFLEAAEVYSGFMGAMN